ncbi:MAG: glycosyltransferase, partial [Candidatus Omnitrophica bacterium]|nr:glycosyltransferase [Candidatus Omnitrophota bacterium]
MHPHPFLNSGDDSDTIPNWPWVECRGGLPDLRPNGSPWPKISIVTPSYQQGEFLEAAICSVLRQKYPHLEYFVIDGGSTDESVEIIRRYEDRIDYWVSQRDRGQSHAINKGFAR